ncbi:MAG: type IX secretion system protein PorQ [Paludibacter sp.]|nr:type IX secretion system protein PorQ [Bacteroidales bacterium]MCM1069723.1 type IX secretion system protein PorQ [Prevotella sp.]MCM1354408.1 type IX secretion system protein PorQ [Bacteroides sp.]MCM1443254.1 type IX secretion system protein PorQ [Muribaculum sp.]MCM1482442.1 type IX secretion system protein PorQ [Paludibacter sp.]
MLVPIQAVAQSGSSVYSFLGLPMSARLNALGGSNVSMRDGEISYALCNPALLNSETDKVLQLNYAYHLQGINIGSALYGQNYKDNYFGVGIHYLDYGKFVYADEYGNLTGGTFSARDVSINLMYARQLGPYFSVGATLKPIYSHYESYSSFALAADVGGHFQTKDSTFQLGLSLQNIGWQLKGFYTEESKQHREPLPLNLQLGMNYRFKHAPIRLSMTLHNLQRWDLGSQLTNQRTESSLTGGEVQSDVSVKWYDMLFRHTIFAIDIVPKSDRFYLTFSYNHRRRMELHISDQRSFAGFAIGGGVRIKKIRAGFAFSQYVKGGYVYQFTLSTDINDFLR